MTDKQADSVSVFLLAEFIKERLPKVRAYVESCNAGETPPKPEDLYTAFEKFRKERENEN